MVAYNWNHIKFFCNKKLTTTNTTVHVIVVWFCVTRSGLPPSSLSVAGSHPAGTQCWWWSRRIERSERWTDGSLSHYRLLHRTYGNRKYCQDLWSSWKELCSDHVPCLLSSLSAPWWPHRLTATPSSHHILLQLDKRRVTRECPHHHHVHWHVEAHFIPKRVCIEWRTVVFIVELLAFWELCDSELAHWLGGVEVVLPGWGLGE